MGERQIGEMATTSTAVATTVSPQLQDESTEPVAVITLRPKRRERKRVVWTEDTVDNENMNKKKSKCCCIYEKPRKFGESDSEESEDECEHCFGHVEKKHHKKETATTSTTQDAPAPEATVETTLRPNSPAPAQPDTNHS